MSEKEAILLRLKRHQTKGNKNGKSLTIEGVKPAPMVKKETVLSAPGKMPCPSWGISARHCKTGAKLRNAHRKKGILTACYDCYALKNNYRLSNVQARLDQNLWNWKQDRKKWREDMKMLIENAGNERFRFYESGDAINEHMIEDTYDIAEHFRGSVSFWAPTQEREYYRNVGKAPDNFNVRVSAPVIDEEESLQGLDWATKSMVYIDSPKGFICEASKRNNKCGLCRACWDKSVDLVSYKKH